MKTKLLLLAALAFASSSSFAQTTLFEDNFDKAGLASPAVSPSQNQPFSGNAGTTSTVSSANHTYTGVNTSLWKLDSSNGTSGLNAIYSNTSSTYSTNLSVQGTSSTVSGAANKATATVAVPVPFTPTLSSNSAKITWSFALRINKGSQLTTLSSAFKPAGALAGGFILATDLSSGGDITTSGGGYAVILAGGSGANNSVTFGSFSGGLNNPTSTTSTFTPLLTVDNLNPVVGATTSASSFSVIVGYTPSTNVWTMHVRADQNNSLQDPQSSTAIAYTASTPASVVNTDNTFNANENMMMYYNYSGTNGMYMDNLKVTSGATTVPAILSVAQNDIKGLSVYPNPITDGKLFINSDSGEAKKVVIYNVLGKQVLSKEVTSGLVDVSTIIKGTYVMKITENGKTSTRKIVIN